MATIKQIERDAGRRGWDIFTIDDESTSIEFVSDVVFVKLIELLLSGPSSGKYKVTETGHLVEVK